MDRPVFWTLLVAAAVLAAVGRLALGRPLFPRRATPLSRGEVALAVAGLLALVFHCAAMFFAPWTDALPGGRLLGEPVRALGAASQWSYWLPAAGLLLAVRRLWWPAPLSLALSLIGVGVTMFWAYPVTTHLWWLATATLTWIVAAASLIGGGAEAARGPVRVGTGRVG